jgi:hypothetical protein
MDDNNKMDLRVRVWRDYLDWIRLKCIGQPRCAFNRQGRSVKTAGSHINQEYDYLSTQLCFGFYESREVLDQLSSCQLFKKDPTLWILVDYTLVLSKSFIHNLILHCVHSGSYSGSSDKCPFGKVRRHGNICIYRMSGWKVSKIKSLYLRKNLLYTLMG